MFKMNLEKNPACENQAKLVPKEISVKQIFDYQITVEKIQCLAGQKMKKSVKMIRKMISSRNILNSDQILIRYFGIAQGG